MAHKQEKAICTDFSCTYVITQVDSSNQSSYLPLEGFSTCTSGEQ